ncbi:tetratricopeptide repeat protein [Candidatus Electronema sp. TJ]|uniref:tetratricopeptide repeat protein n=1 Tax=Candidatus Electronema sp. TJ TaxID=3401573 RepID=UPI003AA94D94
MNDIRLHGAAVYNPALWSREELKNYFVARTELLDRIVADLRQEQPGGPCRHRLILGLRGMGKSTLLRRIGIAVEEDAELGKHWLPLTFPEEQYNISTAADLWRNCLDAFCDLLEERGRKDDADALDKVVDKVEDALALLLAEADKLGCRLLLLMDNMDLILERLKGEQEQLRAIFQRESRLLLIGASTQPVEADFFHATDELQGLSVEEMRATLRKLAELGKTPQVAQLLDDDPARIKTLHNLTDGNPRTIVLLYNVLARGLDGDVRSDLEGLLDLVTPLYKARFEELPQQAQQLMNGLAVNWDPMTARQLADKLVWDVNTASAQLNRLQQQGHVEKVDAASGKRAAFQIGERFFNIWYLMRASRRERRKLIWLVHFLRMFFSAAELQGHAKKLLREEKSDVRWAEYKLALAQTIEDRFLKEELNYDALRCLLRQEKDSRKIEAMFDLQGEDAEIRPLLKNIMHEFNVEELLFYIGENFFFSDHEMSVKNIDFNQIVSCQPEVVSEAFNYLFSLYWDTSLEKRAEQIEYIYRDAIDADPVDARRWSNFGYFLDKLKRFDEAEGTYRKALEIEPDNTHYLYSLGNLLKKNKRFKESEAAYRKILEIKPDHADCWYSLGNLLNDLKRFDEAEAACKKALEIKPDYVDCWWFLSNLLNDLKRFEEAEAACRKVLEIKPDYAVCWWFLGILLTRLERFDEAETAYRKVLEIKPDHADCWYSLGNLLNDLKRFDEAEAACKKALEIKPDYVDCWWFLGILLTRLERFDEAETAYLKALEIKPDDAKCWYNFGFLLNDLKRFDEAEAAYRKSLKIDPANSSRYNTLAWFFYERRDKFDEAIAFAQKSVELEYKLHAVHTLTTLLVANKQWPEAEPHIRALLAKGDDEFFEENWPDMLTLFQEAVRTGRAAEALALLEESPLAERWRPLREALAAAKEGSVRYLNGVAPEVRQPALEILKTIAPDVLPPHPLQGNA